MNRTWRPAVGLAACLLVWLVGAPQAAAQSADDVASRVGTVARAMGAVAKDPWTLDATFVTDVTRGNTDSTNLRSTLVYVADSGDWRFGSYLSMAVESTDGRRNRERAGLNLALARRFTPAFRLVLIEEIVRAPLDGLRARNLLGAMAVWTPDESGRVSSGIYGGAGWASEHRVGARTINYGAGLAGATATMTISETAELSFVGSFTQDLGDAANFRVGTTLSLNAAVTTVLGVQLSYALAYDHEPVDGRVRTNNAVSAGLTLSVKGRQ